jgi:hypothetical protein
MGIFDKLFGRSGQMSDARVEQIINAYGAAMDKPNAIGDERDLPYSKEEIKEAIRRSIPVQDEGMKDMLRAAYVCLADFLPLTNEERQTVQQHNILLAAGIDPQNVTEQELKRFTDHFEKWTDLTSRVAADAAVLRAELDA